MKQVASSNTFPQRLYPELILNMFFMLQISLGAAISILTEGQFDLMEGFMPLICESRVRLPGLGLYLGADSLLCSCQHTLHSGTHFFAQVPIFKC